jgi:hypothetical protein
VSVKDATRVARSVPCAATVCQWGTTPRSSHANTGSTPSKSWLHLISIQLRPLLCYCRALPCHIDTRWNRLCITGKAHDGWKGCTTRTVCVCVCVRALIIRVVRFCPRVRRCIRPWLLSFSNSCPLCRQAIGGDSRIIGGRSGSALRTQPPQSAVQSSAEGRPTSAPVSRQAPHLTDLCCALKELTVGCERFFTKFCGYGGLCRQARRSGHCVAPPWAVSPGSMDAADGAAMGRDPVACERSEEAVGSGSATPAGATDEAALEMAASDRDPRQRRIRQRINEMYRRSVGSRSREVRCSLMHKSCCVL